MPSKIPQGETRGWIVPIGGAENKENDRHILERFIRVALRAQVPIVPIMAAGTDHAYRYLFRDRWIARRVAGGARYDFPVSLGLGVMPLPGKFTYHVGEPILPPGGPELEDDPDALAAFHQHVWQTAQGQLDAAVAQWRAEIGLPPCKRPRR